MANTYTVQRGDTLSEIAVANYKDHGYASKGWNAYMSYLVTLNDIANPNLIYVGQVLKLTGSTTTTSTSTVSYQLVINHFGLQSNAGERTVFATWRWDVPDTDHYYVVWSYDTGDGVGFRGGQEDVESWQKYYVITAPENAISVSISVWPYATYIGGGSITLPGGEVIPGGYSGYKWEGKGQAKTYYFKNNPPSKPPKPTASIKDFTLTAKLEGLDINATEVEFRVIRDNQYYHGSIGKAKILTGTATYSCLVRAGSEYKVECRGVRNGVCGDWSDYSNTVSTKPEASKGITVLRALSDTSVYIEWEPVNKADNYKIEWTTDAAYFDSSNQPQSMEVDASLTSHAEVTGLASGDEYFFRVRASNDNGDSAWTAIKSITIGKAPSSPTTWSSTTTAVAGEKVNLYWVHNARDESSQTYAILEITIDGELHTVEVQNTTDEETKDKTSCYELDTTGLNSGAMIRWRVKTAGILKDDNGNPLYGDWSTTRTIDVYAQPTLTVAITNDARSDQITYAHIGGSIAGGINCRMHYNTEPYQEPYFVHTIGATYTLSFLARSSVDGTAFVSCVAGEYNKKEYVLTTEWQTFTHIYTATADGSLTFWLSEAGTYADITNVVLSENGGNNVIANPNFASSMNSWTNVGLTTFTNEVDNSLSLESLETVTGFPFYAVLESGSGDNQSPISYHVSITSNEFYETTDAKGVETVVPIGGQLYSKHFDYTEDRLEIAMLANNIDLQNGISYTVSCVVSMDSGLTATASAVFTVSWSEEVYAPNAEITINTEDVSAIIRPYCEYYAPVHFRVTYDETTGVYTKTDTTIDAIDGSKVIEFETADDGTILWDESLTTTGEQVYLGADSGGNDLYFCIVKAFKLAPGVLLSVYRREFDGSFTEIITNVDNLSNTHVIDPHPSLDYARYRIVAISTATGAVSYYDMPSKAIKEKAVIIQWDEAWSTFDVTSDGSLMEPSWTGSMLKLPYNIDVSEKNSADVTLVEYIGRSHPVSYYGTQLGESQSWNVQIPKDDIETIYSLRRLAKWMGDVYVREPSGSGYWANITVSFSKKHCEVTIPVTLEITRVEGGV
jgi:hypothetical protein